MEKQGKKLSFPKLLLTILCTTMVSIFIGSTALLVNITHHWLETEKILRIDINSEYLIEIGEQYGNQLEETYKEERELFGKEYPAEMMYFVGIVNYSIGRIIKVYAFSLLIGISLGAIVYIIVVQRAKGKQLIIELIVTLLIVFGLVFLTNLGYQTYINKSIQGFNITNVKRSAYIYELEIYDILITYAIVVIITYIVNLIRQKFLTYKLNKEI